MTNTKLLLSVAAASVLALNGCGGGSSSTDTTTPPPTDTTFQRVTCTDYTPVTGTDTLSGTLSGCLLLTKGTWYLDGKVQVTNGALKIETGSIVAGRTGTKAWLEVMPSGQLIADSVTFTSEEEVNDPQAGAPGQWGGVTLIGADDRDEAGTALNTQLEGYEVDGTAAGSNGTMTDSSGSLTDCTFNNTGIAVEQDKEINGLSLYAVGSGTVIDGIKVNRSGDDAVEIWGGHVALSNVTISQTGDDGFDNDDGWAGSVNNLTVSGVTNSGLELSGNTHATYDNVTINVTGNVATSDVGGAIYLKKSAIGGLFTNVTIIDKQTNGYGTIVTDAADLANLEGVNVVIDATSTNAAGIVTEGPHYDATVATTTDVQSALGL